MPQNYQAHIEQRFAPEALDKMQRAYIDVCNDLGLPFAYSVTRNAVAKAVVEAFESGVDEELLPTTVMESIRSGITGPNDLTP